MLRNKLYQVIEQIAGKFDINIDIDSSTTTEISFWFNGGTEYVFFVFEYENNIIRIRNPRPTLRERNVIRDFFLLYYDLEVSFTEDQTHYLVNIGNQTYMLGGTWTKITIPVNTTLFVRKHDKTNDFICNYTSHDDINIENLVFKTVDELIEFAQIEGFKKIIMEV